MRALARETGGQAFFPSKSAELEAIYTSIARELVSQYALGYVASTPGNRGAFKRVRSDCCLRPRAAQEPERVPRADVDGGRA